MEQAMRLFKKSLTYIISTDTSGPSGDFRHHSHFTPLFAGHNEFQCHKAALQPLRPLCVLKSGIK